MGAYRLLFFAGKEYVFEAVSFLLCRVPNYGCLNIPSEVRLCSWFMTSHRQKQAYSAHAKSHCSPLPDFLPIPTFYRFIHQVGDHVRVRVEAVDVARRRIQIAMVQPVPASSPPAQAYVAMSTSAAGAPAASAAGGAVAVGQARHFSTSSTRRSELKGKKKKSGSSGVPKRHYNSSANYRGTIGEEPLRKRSRVREEKRR